MPDLSVSHLIYTRVESAYSSKSSSGFQVTYVSPDIRADEAEIERMVQCSSLSRWHHETGTPEYRYFWTQNGSVVIAQTAPIPGDQTVIDKAKDRDGSHFVVHAIVLKSEQFARVRNDPFAVIEAALDASVFTDSVELLVQYVREAPPPSIVPVPRRKELVDGLPDGWKKDLDKLALLAQGASDLTSRKQSLLLLSDDSSRVYSLLSTILYLMDVESRITCTFSTYVDGCWPPAGAYWAVGARSRSSGGSFTTMEVSSDAIAIPNTTSSPKASPYSMWWRKNLKNYAEFSVGMPEIYTAQTAAESLAARRVLPTDDPLSERALTTFREVNLEHYKSGMMRALAAVLGKSLTAQSFDALVISLSIERLINMGATESVMAADIAPDIYLWALAHSGEIKGWGDVLKFAQTAAFDPLIVLAGSKMPTNLITSLSGSKAFSASHQALDRLVQRGESTPVLEELRSVVDVDRLVTARTAAIIVAQTDLDTLEDTAFVDLTTALFNVSPQSIDESYPARAIRVKDKGKLKAIIRLAKKSGHLEGAFTQSAQVSG